MRFFFPLFSSNHHCLGKTPFPFADQTPQMEMVQQWFGNLQMNGEFLIGVFNQILMALNLLNIAVFLYLRKQFQ